MAYYNVCPNCGGNLDPCEKCDCEIEKENDMKIYISSLKREASSGQLAFVIDYRENSKV